MSFNIPKANLSNQEVRRKVKVKRRKILLCGINKTISLLNKSKNLVTHVWFVMRIISLTIVHIG